MAKPLITYDPERDLRIDVAHVDEDELDASLEMLAATNPSVEGTIVKLSGVELVQRTSEGYFDMDLATNHLYGLGGLLSGVDKNTDRYLVPRLGQNRLDVWVGMSAQEYFNSSSHKEEDLVSVVLAMAEVYSLYTGEEPTPALLRENSHGLPYEADRPHFASYGYALGLSPGPGVFTDWFFPGTNLPGDPSLHVPRLEETDISLAHEGCLYRPISYNIDYPSQTLAFTLGVGRLAYFAAKDRD